MTALLKNKGKFGIKKVAEKKQRNISQEVNFIKKVRVHIMLHGKKVG